MHRIHTITPVEFDQLDLSDKNLLWNESQTKWLNDPYSLAPIYDELVSEWYFDYKALADSLIQMIGIQKKVLELWIWSGNVATILESS